MNGCTLIEVPWFERLLGFKFTPNFNWNSYTRSIIKDTGRLVGTLYCSRKHLIPALSLQASNSILYLYKSQRKKWSIAVISGLGRPNPLFSPLTKAFTQHCKRLFSALHPLPQTQHRNPLVTPSLFLWIFRWILFLSSTSSGIYN